MVKLNVIKEAERKVDELLGVEVVREEVTLDTIKDLVIDLKKKGFTDEKKLQGSLNRAKELAKQQGKEEDKKTIIGIFQKFFQSK
jgi:hypothetical protein